MGFRSFRKIIFCDSRWDVSAIRPKVTYLYDKGRGVRCKDLQRKQKSPRPREICAVGGVLFELV